MAAPKAASEEKAAPENADGFKAVDAPDSIDLPTDQIDKETVLFWIERSKNKNIVVYEAEKTEDTLDHYNNVVGYWLKIEPSYVAKNRQKGKKDDRVEINMVEKKVCFRVTT